MNDRLMLGERRVRTKDRETEIHTRRATRRQGEAKDTAQSKGSGATNAPARTVRLRMVWYGLGTMLFSGMLVACMNGLYRAIENSEMLALEGIEIQGNSRIPTREIVDRAGIPLGINIFTLKCDNVARRIEEHPWIAHASIIKRFPHRVIIHVKEREPAALVAAGDLYYVDAQGVVFHKVGPGDSKDFPVVTGFHEKEVLTQMHKAFEPITKTMDLIRVIQHYPAQVRISEIHFDPRRGWTVYPLKFPVPVYLGVGELEQKIVRLVRIYHELIDLNPPPELVDLSYPYQVVVRKAAQKRDVCTTVKAIPSRARPSASGPST
jgi:cell division protein FtsQ